jgi:hypothetical protein
VSAVDDGYVCPNGHAVDPVRVHNCPTCRAGVVYVPGEHCTLLPVALALVLTYIGVRGWVGVVVDFALGLGFAQLRWMIWRRRHPLITTEQWLDEQRRAAPWN